MKTIVTKTFKETTLLSVYRIEVNIKANSGITIIIKLYLIIVQIRTTMCVNI